MFWMVIVATAWAVAAVVVGLALGRAIRAADQRESRPRDGGATPTVGVRSAAARLRAPRRTALRH